VTEVLRISISLVPVLAFLIGLRFLDSFKLVTPRSLVRTLAGGVVAAGICLILTRDILIGFLHIDENLLLRAIGPWVEESVKGMVVVLLFRTGRIGFMVDAAIRGFAVGAGFALIENIYYLHALGDTGLTLWFVRGLGTAVMHGAATAIFAILSRYFSERTGRNNPLVFLPGILAAWALHALFNNFILPPLATSMAMLAVAPMAFLLVYERSEKATRQWLGVGFDTDADMLEQIQEGRFEDTRVGRYLQSLQANFQAAVVGDMFCLLQVHLELSLKAKGLLLARDAGLDVPIGEETLAQLEELAFLEKAIGTTGMLAMSPILEQNLEDAWQHHLLRKQHETGTWKREDLEARIEEEGKD
jgi:RsiW-degrading membrane proteinase PrsW (M82 family)